MSLDSGEGVDDHGKGGKEGSGRGRRWRGQLEERHLLQGSQQRGQRGHVHEGQEEVACARWGGQVQQQEGGQEQGQQ